MPEHEDVAELPPPAIAGAPVTAAPQEEDKDRDDADDEPQPAFDEGPVHRPLIRAQLARPEGIKIERQAPEFTIRQNPNGRGGGGFRGGSGGGDMRARGGGGAGRSNGGGGGSNNGHRFGRGPRPAGGGGGGRPNQGFGRGPGGGQQRSGRPPKRSR